MSKPILESLARERRLRRRLVARLTRLGYALERVELRVGGHLIVPFTRVVDPDRVLDDVVRAADRRERESGVRQPDDELHLPYWAELWDSALGIAEFLANPQSKIRNPQSVLDLGCGMGLAGTVAALLGHRVMLADIEPPALLFARLNSLPYVRVIKRPPQPGYNGRTNRNRQKIKLRGVRVRRVDWRRDHLKECFDVILGADVLYDRAQWEYLEPFWRAHLREAREAFVLLGEPGRQTGELFEPWIEARGWRLERSHVHVSTRDSPIRLFKVSLRDPQRADSV